MPSSSWQWLTCGNWSRWFKAWTFDLVVSLDNALPHLETDAELERAWTGFPKPLGELAALSRARIRDSTGCGGIGLRVSRRKRAAQRGERRVSQVWRWSDDLRRLRHRDCPGAGRRDQGLQGRYRALTCAELTRALEASGFAGVDWLTPEDNAYYQPIAARAAQSVELCQVICGSAIRW